MSAEEDFSVVDYLLEGAVKVQLIQRELEVPDPLRSPEEYKSYKAALQAAVNGECTGIVLEFADATWFASVPEVWRERAGEIIGLLGFPQHKNDPDPHAPTYISYPSYNHYDGQTRGALIAVAAAIEALPVLRDLIHEERVGFSIVAENRVKLTWPTDQAHRLVSQAQTA